jgi:hypothetical protein
MVRVFGLQSSDQKVELRKVAQTRKARIFQEERPAGEPPYLKMAAKKPFTRWRKPLDGGLGCVSVGVN